MACQENFPVLINGIDLSPPSGVSVLPGVIERSQRTIIAHGVSSPALQKTYMLTEDQALDMVLISNGTLLMIQNMTWNGALGFKQKPSDPFYVPYHDDPSLPTLAGAGVFGTTHTERGLTWVSVDLSGHSIFPKAVFCKLLLIRSQWYRNMLLLRLTDIWSSC